jgi:hypothetical protein
MIDLLDYNKEFDRALVGLQKAGAEIEVKKVCATVDQFTMNLSESPTGMHFSGHGVQNKIENIGMQNAELKGNCLVFETKDGAAHFVSEHDLKTLLERSCSKPLDFVFIASCHSEFTGNIFHNAGVRHVICIK